MQKARDDHLFLLLISGSLWSWFQETRHSNLMEQWTVCNALEKQRKWIFEQFAYIMHIYKCGTKPIYKILKWTNIFFSVHYAICSEVYCFVLVHRQMSFSTLVRWESASIIRISHDIKLKRNQRWKICVFKALAYFFVLPFPTLGFNFPSVSSNPTNLIVSNWTFQSYCW